MRPYYADGAVTIYHGDCRDVLASLEPESVDAVLTDPPYGISYQSARSAASALPRTVANDSNLNALRDALALLDRVLRPNRHAYIFAAPMRIGEAGEAVGQYWQVKNLLVWDKGNAGSKGDLEAGYAANWEAIIYASKGRRALNGPRPRCVIRYDWQAWRDPVHPTVKPAGLMHWLVTKSTQAGELLIDPFMGSGVSLRAAAELGRRAVGIEMEERYCEVAAQRLLRPETAARSAAAH